MPRRTRLDQPGLPQHVIRRGNNRSACFFADDDSYCYLHWLRKAAHDHGVAVHAYVPMTNHVHILATPATHGALATIMQSLGRRYVRYVNATYQRSGTLWEGRYKAGVVDAEVYLLRVYRYIELNPVRANMVSHPREYPWSSYAINSGGKANDWLKPHELYLALGSGPTERVESYVALFRTELDPDEMLRIRTVVNLGIGVGDARFQEAIEAAAQARKQGGRKRKDKRAEVGEQVDLFLKRMITLTPKTPGGASSPAWLDTAAVHGYVLGRDAVTNADTRRAATRYAVLVVGGKGVKLWDEALAQQMYLGDQAFVDRMQKRIEPARAGSKEISRRQRRSMRKPIQHYLDRNKDRDAGIVAAVRDGQHSLTATANVVGLSVSRVSRIVRRAEIELEQAKGKT